MSRYFVHARVVARALGARASIARRRRRMPRPCPTSRRNLQLTATASSSSTREGAADEPASWLRGVRGWRSTAACRCPTTRSRCIERRGGRYAPRRLPADARTIGSVSCGCCGRAAGSTRGSRRCTTAACSAGCSRVQQISSARDSRLLPQVHGRRAHAADHPRPRATARHRHGPGADASPACCASCTRPSSSCSRCCSTTSASGRRTTTPRKASAWRRRCSIGSSSRPDARHDVEFLIGQHLQMSQVAFRRDNEDPAGHRQFAALVGTEERLKMLSLMTLVDIDAVSPTTLTPWKEELLWRVYVDTYNQLTLAYGDEVIEHGQAAVAALLASRPPDIDGARADALSRGLPAPLPGTLRSRRTSISTPGWRATSIATRSTSSSSRRARSGSWPSSRSTSPTCSRTSAGAVRTSAWTSCAAARMTSPAGLVLDIFQFTDQEGFFRLQRRGARRSSSGCCRTWSPAVRTSPARLARKERGPLHRRGAAARRADRPLRQRAFADATRCSRSSRRTRSGCCIASAG